MTAISDCQSDLVVGIFHTRLFFPLVHWEFSTRNICTRGKKGLVWKIPTTRSDWQSEIADTLIDVAFITLRNNLVALLETLYT